MLQKVILEMVSVGMDIPALCSFVLRPWELRAGKWITEKFCFPEKCISSSRRGPVPAQLMQP